ncbi:hypothetical protein ACIG0C_25050 [Kitasatospora aureofaciens]|uniref:Uncharacterized protein n=1 Tax=Kitasatospora aureofaciens TaxID=1894 RepID=A0A1E7NBN1_KITAU|nr:hypothetical protein [Kitasatospora aureofaciens]ARF79689.1 hypothetical protein B6264_12940 [Kitasatospora aureofaciens]OEV38102.1 hypothetical protein HS99_0023160 [Kitasatospora aureofaciens]GGU87652.1 hypothetical protein GCM10010502_45250 [Kitasatospora aureofaciens]
MPQDHEDYLIDETVETVEPDEEVTSDEYDEVAERRALGADPATDVADAAEQNRIVQLDEDDYRE